MSRYCKGFLEIITDVFHVIGLLINNGFFWNTNGFIFSNTGIGVYIHVHLASEYSKTMAVSNVGLCNSMARTVKLLCEILGILENKVFLVSRGQRLVCELKNAK